MCRSIQRLYNLDPPATQEEIRAAAQQYVRKISGFRKPSRVNAAEFAQAVEAVTAITDGLLAALVTDSPAQDRQVLAARQQARRAERFAHG
jgi:hypothetical protein